jgi:RimJ/RimL family protein N-acetyltransferase
MMVKEDTRHPIMAFLPLSTSLPDGRPITIDYMTPAQLTETYNMIQEAAINGDGFGEGEFYNEEEFLHDVSSGSCFAVTNNGELTASFILCVSKYYRGPAIVADPTVIVRKEERHRGIGEFCMQQVVEFSKRLGFIALYLDTFSTNLAIQRILEKLGGFTRVGCLPVGGKLVNGRTVSSIIYYRDLS